MPKAKTTKKKPATRVGGGGVGTRVSKLNLKIVIPIVVVVAALGGFYIFKKSSAQYYNGHPDSLYGAGGINTKTDGNRYRMDYHGEVFMNTGEVVFGNYINTGRPLKICADIWHVTAGTRHLYANILSNGGGLEFTRKKIASISSPGGRSTRLCGSTKTLWYRDGVYRFTYFGEVEGDKGFGVSMFSQDD